MEKKNKYAVLQKVDHPDILHSIICSLIMKIPATNFLDVWKRFLKAKRLWFKKPYVRWPFAGILFLFLALLIFSLNPTTSTSSSFLPFFGSLQRLLGTDETSLVGEDDGRVNILLLGIGGEQHEGGLLTDTIILVSVNTQTKETTLLSIPRDLVVPTPELGWRKVNSIHAFAELNQRGAGGEKTIAALSDILGVHIPYYIRIDFSGFETLIDDLNGIYVDVEQTLNDPRYPVTGRAYAYPIESRYEHLFIEVGPQWFDGATALKYARSRRALGKEGSDFARARRQQKILLAVRERALSFSTIINPRRITAVLQTLGKNIETNLSIREMMRLTSFAKDITTEAITTVVLDSRPGGFLIERKINGAFILEPMEGNFDRIRTLAQGIFDSDIRKKLETVEKPSRIIIENGTTIPGLAATTAARLQQQGFAIVRVTNAERQTVEKTTVIDFTNGTKEEALTRLQSIVQSDVLKTTPAHPEEAIDFLLVLGSDAAQ